MERLNEIMARALQRQREHEAQQDMPEQRNRPVTRPTRYTPPEQTAHLGKYAPPEHRLAPRPRPEQTGAHPTRASFPQSRLQSSAAHRPTAPRESTWPNSRNMPAYQGDSYHPDHADVQDNWEDDTANMRFGDWEDDVLDNDLPPENIGPEKPMRTAPPVSRGAMRIAQTYGRSNRPQVTRQLHSQPEPETRLPLVRPPVDRQATREVRLPAPQPQVQPAPEIYRSHRVTQPLNRAQALAHLSQNDQHLIREPNRQPRQSMIREQQVGLIPAPYNPSSAICPICKGAGYLRADVPYGHPNFGKPIACECKEVERKNRRRQQLQELSNLGDLRDKTFENFRPNVSRPVQEAYLIAQEYADDPQGWLVMIGKVGCGKTHLAAAIANKALSRGCLVLFSTVSDLLDHLRATYAPNSTEVYDQLFHKMREAALLVLDDLGAQQSSPWANEKLFQLLNYRYNSRFPTIITTNNLGLQGIEERVRSRMMDTSLVTTINFEGTGDYRLRNPRRE